MSYEQFFAGAGATLLGTLVGVWLGSHLSYRFQKKLLEQQLEFQKQQAVADALLRKEISAETTKAIADVRDMVCKVQQYLGSLNHNFLDSLKHEKRS